MADSSLNELAVRASSLLRKHEMLLVTAESCTGGLIAASITQQSGASDIFERGFITYSNTAKHEELGVSNETLQNHGAVSEQTATEMAQGALKNSHADIAISVTGIAGPNSDDTQKPVGLVYIGLAERNNKAAVHKHNFDGTRVSIQEQTAKAALQHLIDHMKDMSS